MPTVKKLRSAKAFKSIPFILYVLVYVWIGSVLDKLYVNKNKWGHASGGGQRHSMSPEMTDSPIFWEPEYIFVRLQPPTLQTKHTKYELISDHVADNSGSPQNMLHKDLSTFILIHPLRGPLHYWGSSFSK
jgi:hypothetical protein